MWFFFALTFALVTSISVIVAKRVLKEIDEYIFLWLSAIFTVPFLFLITIFFYEIPKVDLTFFIAVGTSTVIGLLAAIFAYRAIKISDVSLISPISSFNPVFTTVLAFLFLGEKVGIKGVVGILAVVSGAYVMQISELKKGVLTPLRVLFTNRAVQLSLVAYFIWALTPLLEKTAIIHTSPNVPPFVALTSFVLGSFLYIPIVLKFSRSPRDVVKKYMRWFVLIGVLGGIGQASAFIAFSLTNLGFATAIFKLSMIFTVLFGWLFFREVNIRDRLLGSLLMLLGVFLLAT